MGIEIGNKSSVDVPLSVKGESPLLLTLRYQDSQSIAMGETVACTGHKFKTNAAP